MSSDDAINVATLAGIEAVASALGIYSGVYSRGALPISLDSVVDKQRVLGDALFAISEEEMKIVGLKVLQLIFSMTYSILGPFTIRGMESTGSISDQEQFSLVVEFLQALLDPQLNGLQKADETAPLIQLSKALRGLQYGQAHPMTIPAPRRTKSSKPFTILRIKYEACLFRDDFRAIGLSADDANDKFGEARLGSWATARYWRREAMKILGPFEIGEIERTHQQEFRKTDRWNEEALFKGLKALKEPFDEARRKAREPV